MQTHQRIVWVRRCQRGCRLSCELVKLGRRHALVDAHRNLLRDEHLRKHAAASAAEHQFEYFRELGTLRPAATAKHSELLQQALAPCCDRSPWLKHPKEGAHWVAEVRIETIRQLHDPGRDLVKVDGLLAPITLDDKHGAVCRRHRLTTKTTLQTFAPTKASNVRAVLRPQHTTGLEPYVAGRQQVEQRFAVGMHSMQASSQLVRDTKAQD